MYLTALAAVAGGGLGGASLAQTIVSPPPSVEAPVKQGKTVYSRTAVTTSSTEFEAVPGLSGAELCSRFARGVLANGSFTLSGGPAAIRIVARSFDSERTLKPGAFRFEVGSEPDTRSGTYAHRTRIDDKSLVVEWRSPTGAEVTLHKGAVQYLFKAKRPKNPCL